MESYTNIYNAIEIGDSESLKRSWTKSIDIDFHDKNENSFIMLAVKYQQQEIVAYLLTFNPNLYLCNNENETVFQIAERLEDKTIFKMLLDDCWKENEKLFLFEYHANPNFDTEALGAYINCWVMNEDFNHAKEIGQIFIHNQNWKIDSIEDITEIKKGDLTEENDKFQYYEQVIIDKEILVFYTYDSLDDA
jgi:ankyrin repeat protein